MPKRPLILVGDYSEIAQGLVHWYDDDYETPGDPVGLATHLAYLARPGRRIGNVFVGDDKGRIFVEDTEDATPFVGESFIVPSHLIVGDAGGGPDEGKHVVRCWSYVESERSAWELRIWSGDERAYPPFGDPDLVNLIREVKPWGETIAASEQTGIYPAAPAAQTHDTLAQPKTVHSHQPEKETSGRGFTWEFRFLNPLGVRFYGFGFVSEPGRARRPIVQATRVTPSTG
jgi:hypothetical protein